MSICRPLMGLGATAALQARSSAGRSRSQSRVGLANGNRPRRRIVRGCPGEQLWRAISTPRGLHYAPDVDKGMLAVHLEGLLALLGDQRDRELFRIWESVEIGKGNRCDRGHIGACKRIFRMKLRMLGFVSVGFGVGVLLVLRIVVCL